MDVPRLCARVTPVVCALALLTTAVPHRRAQDTRAADEPLFRPGVTRVEVSALVRGREGEPVRGLTAADVEIAESGVAQVIRSFVPFT